MDSNKGIFRGSNGVWKPPTKLTIYGSVNTLVPFRLMDLLTHLNLDKRFQDQTADWFTALVKETEGNQLVNYYLGGGFKYFLLSPLVGEMIQFDEHIFQMGWFDHQLVVGYPNAVGPGTWNIMKRPRIKMINVSIGWWFPNLYHGTWVFHQRSIHLKLLV